MLCCPLDSQTRPGQCGLDRLPQSSPNVSTVICLTACRAAWCRQPWQWVFSMLVAHHAGETLKYLETHSTACSAKQNRQLWHWL